MSNLDENETNSTVEQKNNEEIPDEQRENPSQPLFEQPIILQGKRSRKPTARLELTDLSPPRKEIIVPKGRGKPLGQIKYIHHQIENASNDDLQRLNSICFGRRTSKIEAQKNLRDFRGFEFDRKSDEFQNALKNLSKLKKDQIKSIEDILGLSSTGSTNEQAESILEFLVEPIDHGKSISERRVTTRVTRPKPKVQKPVQNGNDFDDFDDFDDEEDSQESESDEDYLGTDEETNLTTKDDPDDFAYQPGKKAPKRKSPLKRTRTSSSSKRKRVSTSKTKRNSRKKPEALTDEQPKPEEKDIEPENTEENQVEKVEEKKEENQSSIDAEIPVEAEKSSE